MEIQRIDKLETWDIISILEMSSLIRDEDYIPKDYVCYLSNRISSPEIAFFGVFNEDDLVGFIHCERGHPILRKYGWIVLSIMTPGLDKKYPEEALRAAESWFLENGASAWQLLTKRSERALERSYGAQVDPERKLMVKVLKDE